MTTIHEPAVGADPLALDQQVCFAVVVAARSVVAYLRAVDPELNISLECADVWHIDQYGDDLRQVVVEYGIDPPHGVGTVDTVLATGSEAITKILFTAANLGEAELAELTVRPGSEASFPAFPRATGPATGRDRHGGGQQRCGRCSADCSRFHGVSVRVKSVPKGRCGLGLGAWQALAAVPAGPVDSLWRGAGCLRRRWRWPRWPVHARLRPPRMSAGHHTQGDAAPRVTNRAVAGPPAAR